jgi:hypothetical protein
LPAPDALEALGEIVATRRLREAWERLRGQMQHQASVTSAALPHLIRLAPTLTPREQRDLWIDAGFLVIAGAGSLHGKEPVPGMQEALTQSLRDAEPLALQAFLDAEELDRKRRAPSPWPAWRWPVTRSARCWTGSCPP